MRQYCKYFVAAAILTTAEAAEDRKSVV